MRVLGIQSLQALLGLAAIFDGRCFLAMGFAAPLTARWTLDFAFFGVVPFGDDRDDEIARLKSKVGEITMDNELLCSKIEALEGKRPLAQAV